MEIEIKPGLNFIVGGRAYTAQELIRLQRKLIFGLFAALIIAAPLAFGVGLIAGSNDSPQIVLMSQK